MALCCREKITEFGVFGGLNHVKVYFIEYEYTTAKSVTKKIENIQFHVSYITCPPPLVNFSANPLTFCTYIVL
jgi:hypothetical protein